MLDDPDAGIAELTSDPDFVARVRSADPLIERRIVHRSDTGDIAYLTTVMHDRRFAYLPTAGVNTARSSDSRLLEERVLLEYEPSRLPVPSRVLWVRVFLPGASAAQHLPSAAALRVDVRAIVISGVSPLEHGADMRLLLPESARVSDICGPKRVLKAHTPVEQWPVHWFDAFSRRSSVAGPIEDRVIGVGDFFERYGVPAESAGSGSWRWLVGAAGGAALAGAMALGRARRMRS